LKRKNTFETSPRSVIVTRVPFPSGASP